MLYINRIVNKSLKLTSASYDCGDISLVISKHSLTGKMRYGATLWYKCKDIASSTGADTKQEALKDLIYLVEWELKEYKVKTIPELLIKMEEEK